MPRPSVIWGLLALWLVLCALSLIVPANTVPSATGLTRGLDRVTIFFQYQIAALVLALLIFVLARHSRGAALRRAGQVPLFAAVISSLLMVGGIFWASRLQHPEGAPPPPAPGGTVETRTGN